MYFLKTIWTLMTKLHIRKKIQERTSYTATSVRNLKILSVFCSKPGFRAQNVSAACGVRVVSGLLAGTDQGLFKWRSCGASGEEKPLGE